MYQYLLLTYAFHLDAILDDQHGDYNTRGLFGKIMLNGNG
jgi:hypothetical protein